MFYSPELKSQVSNEIKRLEEQEKGIRSAIDDLQSILDIPEPAIPARIKRSYNKTASADQEEEKSMLASLFTPKGRKVRGKVDIAVIIKYREDGMSVKDIAKKVGYSQSGVAKALGNAGVKVPTRPYNKKHGNFIPKELKPVNGNTKKDSLINNTANRFTLDRDFTLEDKEINLMRSYLLSWKGMGRLEPDEIKGLEWLAPVRLENLIDAQRMTIRDIFYACRARVMDKTKTLSKITGSSSTIDKNFS